MRAVVQRVTMSDVTSEGTLTGSIGRGLNVLLGVGEGDTEADVEYMANKVAGLRIFEDEDDKMNLSVADIGGEILVVSQFTLYGDVRKGKRPSFTAAAKPDEAERLYGLFCEKLRSMGFKVGEGVFQTEMLVRIFNDGPVTILLDSKKVF